MIKALKKRSIGIFTCDLKYFYFKDYKNNNESRIGCIICYSSGSELELQMDNNLSQILFENFTKNNYDSVYEKSFSTSSFEKNIKLYINKYLVEKTKTNVIDSEISKTKLIPLEEKMLIKMQPHQASLIL